MRTLLKLIAPLVVRCAPVIIWLAKHNPKRHLKHPDGSPYMNRYWAILPRWITGGWSARVHEIVSSDDDRALHDHPWPYHSIVLKGGYFEVFDVYYWYSDAYRARWKEWADEVLEIRWEEQTQSWVIGRWVGAGEVNSGTPKTFHRLRLDNVNGNEQSAWTLFFMGPRRQNWGFLVNGLKVPSKEYTSERDPR